MTEYAALAYQNTRDAIMITRTDGTIVDVNPAFERLYGYLRDEILEQAPSFLKSGRHDATFYERIWHALRRGMVWEGNIYNRRKNGTILLIEETICITKNDDGDGYYMATMREPIMQGSDKGHRAPNTRDTMVAGLAHDFNNLVSPLLGYAEMASLKLNNGHSPQNELEQILKAGTRARQLAQQVLTFCRHETAELEVVFLDGVIKDVLSLQAIAASDRIQLTSDIGEKCGTIMGEPIQMHQVLMNLCTNGLHAMRETGGVLNVSLHSAQVDNNSPYLGDLKPGAYIKLSVSDTGCGMDEKTMRQAFDPFFTSKGSGGVGLGLAMVQQIIHDHGGEIYVKSEIDVGSTFDILLPCRDSHRLSDTQTIPIAEMPVGHGTILLVDDEQAIVQMGKNMLEYIGYNVVGLTGSQQALERFRTRPFDFDLIITDQVMPGLRGIELAEAARDIRQDIPIIFVTGFLHKLPKEEVVQLGNCASLQKPFSSSELVAAVSSLLGETDQ